MVSLRKNTVDPPLPALRKEDILQKKKTLSIKTVLIMGVIIGIAVVVIAIVALKVQQRKTLEASIAGTLPKMEEKTGWQALSTDPEGKHDYIIEKSSDGSEDIVGVWQRLTYSKEGRGNYILKRRNIGLFITGMDTLAYRYTLYHVRCKEQPVKYTIMKVFEVSQDGKTLDYGKAGSQKDWEEIPKDTIIDKLANAACQ